MRALSTPRQLRRVVHRAALGSVARVTDVAASLWRQVVQEGDTVVDATCGRGFDAVQLAQLAGASGQLLCFDIQAESIESTRWNLCETLQYTFDDPMEGASPRGAAVKLFQASHAELSACIETAPRVVCFNLGYLPRSDKRVMTVVATTLAAVEAALAVLMRGGVATVVAYCGHEEGQREFDALQKFATALSPQEWTVTEFKTLNRRLSPRLFAFWKL